MTTDVDTLPDGLHEGIPFEDYLRIKAISNSGALVKMRRSPLYFMRTQGDSIEATPDMNVGSAVNDLVLVPKVFESRLVVSGPCVATLQKGGRCGNNGSYVVGGFSYCGKHVPPGVEPDPRITITAEQFKRSVDMADAVLNDEAAAPLLARCSMREVTLLWHDKPTGLRCKGRIDACEPVTNPFMGPVVIDLKKSAKAHPDTFPGEILKRNYHGQLAFYDDGIRTLLGCESKPHIIAVNDVKADDVHEVGTYPIISDAIEAGRAVNRRLLDAIHECRRRNHFPGFGHKPLSIPAWAIGRDDENEDDEGGSDNG